MGGDPADDDVVVSREYHGTDLHGGGNEALAGGDGVGSHPIDGSRGVHKNCLSVAILLSPVERAEGLAYGVALRAEDLLTVVEAAGPPARGPPDICCSHLFAVQTRAVGPDSVPGPPPPLLRGLKSLLSPLDDDLAGVPLLPGVSRKVVGDVRVCGVDAERMPVRRDAECMRWQVQL